MHKSFYYVITDHMPNWFPEVVSTVEIETTHENLESFLNSDHLAECERNDDIWWAISSEEILKVVNSIIGWNRSPTNIVPFSEIWDKETSPTFVMLSNQFSPLVPEEKVSFRLFKVTQNLMID